MPAPPPPEPAPQNIQFGSFDGIKNTVTRERLGPRDLMRAVNVDLDDTGQLHRRRGFTQVASGDFHSLFTANNGTVYGVKNGALGIVYPDYSFATLRMGVGGDYSVGQRSLAYAEVGNEIFYSCLTDSGVIDQRGGTVGDWGPNQDFWLSPVVNPTTTLSAVRGKLLGRPPLATAIAYYSGRIYLASKRTLWATEHFLYHLTDKTRTFFNFEGEITMVGAVTDGVYVGTDEGLWFLGGPRFEELRRERIMDSPVIPGSMVYIPAELANPPEIGLDRRPNPTMQVSLAFMTTRGFCVAEDGGKAVNLSEGRVFFPVAQRSAAFFRRQDGMNQYVAVNDSGGSPVNGAAIGDYVDATIIRGRDKWVQENEQLKMGDQFAPTWIIGG